MYDFVNMRFTVNKYTYNGSKILDNSLCQNRLKDVFYTCLYH